MKTPLTVAVAQLNCVVGDISGNARRILDAVARAKAAGADVVLTPELALCGYPPEDLLLRPAFLQACADELAALAAQVQGITVLVGYPAEQDGLRFNAAAVIRDGRIVDELFQASPAQLRGVRRRALFRRRQRAAGVRGAGVRIGVNICADVWEPGAPKAARRRRAGFGRAQRLALAPGQAAAPRSQVLAIAHGRYRHAGGVLQSGRRAG
jgi:NAD+ synthase (glutamine-hydrolysing)